MKIYLKNFVAAVFLSIAATSWTMAFNIDDTTLKNKKMFGIEFADGTSFYGQAALVASISKSEYIVGNAIFVTEISISMSGSPNNLRIYYAIPMNSEHFKKILERRTPESATDRLVGLYSAHDAVMENPAVKQFAADAKTVFASVVVHKDYPMTTHSKNIEFIVNDLEELEAFYDRLSADFGQKTGEKKASAAKNSDTSKSASDDKINPSMNGRVYNFAPKKDSEGKTRK